MSIGGMRRYEEFILCKKKLLKLKKYIFVLSLKHTIGASCKMNFVNSLNSMFFI